MSLTLLMILGLLGVVAAQTEDAKPPSERPTTEASVYGESVSEAKEAAHDHRGSGGLWPSHRLWELLISRWADDAAARYELSDEQSDRFREKLLDRWMQFLDENRDEFEPLANELLEMRLGLEPPDKQQVQSWAERALPHFRTLRDQYRESQDEFREQLTPRQRVRYEIDSVKSAAGLQLAENRLNEWSRGHVDPADLWEPLPSMRDEPSGRIRREGQRRGVEAELVRATSHRPPAALPVQVAVELSAWEQYVVDFIVVNELDEGQRTAAISCLKEISERARTHSERRRVEIEALEARIAINTGTAEELAEIKAELDEFYGPIDGMFAELKGRLDSILTLDQRARAEQRLANPAADSANTKPAADEAKPVAPLRPTEEDKDSRTKPPAP